MKTLHKSILLPCILLLFFLSAGMDAHFYPDVLLLDSKGIVAVKQRIAADEKSLAPALKKLRDEADQALKSGIFSVMHKKINPPSGDKHDYMSMGPYW